MEGKGTFCHSRAVARRTYPTSKSPGQRQKASLTGGKVQAAQLALATEADQETVDRPATIQLAFKASLTGNKPVLEEVRF